jgi:hypothetical protein
MNVFSLGTSVSDPDSIRSADPCPPKLSPKNEKMKKKKNFNFEEPELPLGIQGADDKLGQFLDQDFEASANHRNVLRLSLESCPSLVSPNAKKPSIFTKICRQNTKLVQ